MKWFYKIFINLSVVLCLLFCCVGCDSGRVYITGLSLSQQNQDKLVLLWGTKIDRQLLKSVKVKVNTSDGGSVEVCLADCEIDEFNNKPFFADGENETINQMRISYAGHQMLADVLIYRKAERISLEENSISESVLQGDETATTNQAVLLVVYNDGYIERISDHTKFNLGEYSVDEIGRKTLDVAYEDKYAGMLYYTWYYQVERNLESIEISGAYPKSVKYGSPVSDIYSGVRVLAHYADGDSFIPFEDVTLTQSINTMPYYVDGEFVSEQKFRLTYKNVSVDSDVIKVYSELEELKYVSGLPQEILYGQEIDISNLIVKAKFSQNDSNCNNWITINTQDLDIDYSMLATPSENQTDKKTVKISYSHNNGITNVTKETEVQNCIIVYDELKSISVSALDFTDKTTYYILKEDIDNELTIESQQKFKITANFYYQNSFEITKDDIEWLGVSFSQLMETSVENQFKVVISFEFRINDWQNNVIKTCDIFINAIDSWNDVEDITIESIEIVDGAPTELVYNASLDDLKTLIDGRLTLVIHYSGTNNTSTIIYDKTCETTDANYIGIIANTTPDGSYIGSLTLTYGGCEVATSLDIKREVVSIELSSSLPSRIKYGDSSFFEDVDLIVTFSNGTIENFNASDVEEVRVTDADNIDIDNFGCFSTFDNQSLSCYHEKQIAIILKPYYDSHTRLSGNNNEKLVVEFTLYEEIENLEIDSETTSIMVGSDFNADECVVKVVYSSGNKITVGHKTELKDGYVIISNVHSNESYSAQSYNIETGAIENREIIGFLGWQNFVVSYSYSCDSGETVITKTIYGNKEFCVEDQLQDCSIGGIGDLIYKDCVVDKTKICLIPHYKSHEHYNSLFAENGIVVGDIDTSTLGIKTLEVSFGGKIYTKSIEVIDNVFNDDDYVIEGVMNPENIARYYYRSSLSNLNSNFGTETIVEQAKNGFNVGNDYDNDLVYMPYIIGSENSFIYSPRVIVSYTHSTGPAIIDSGYLAKLTVTFYNDDLGEESELATISSQEIDANADANLITYYFDANESGEYDADEIIFLFFNKLSHEIRFSENAEDLEFDLTIVPQLVENNTNMFCSLHCLVVKGFNVYTPEELSLIDNAELNIGSKNEPQKKWETKNIYGDGVRSDLLKSYIEENGYPEVLVLHNDIVITNKDIPACHFYCEDEINSEDLDYHSALYSFKNYNRNDALRFIYCRSVEEGKQFKIEGNYFNVDCSKLAINIRKDGDGAASLNIDGESIESFTSLIGILGEIQSVWNEQECIWEFFDSDLYGEVANTSQVASANINNLKITGNLRIYKDGTNGGGIIGLTSRNVNLAITNCLFESLSIGSVLEGNNVYSNNVVIKINKTNIFNVKQCFIKLNSVRTLKINSCNFIGCVESDIVELNSDNFETNIYIDQNISGFDKHSIIEK